jgi:hypothetical protein
MCWSLRKAKCCKTKLTALFLSHTPKIPHISSGYRTAIKKVKVKSEK